MTKRFGRWSVIAIVGIPLLLTRTAFGQDPADRDSWVGGEDLWTNNDGWVDDTNQASGAPSPVDLDRWALVQSGNVIVDGDIGTSGLTINGGAVQINAGGSLTVDIVDDAFSVGQMQIGGNGTLRLLGDAKFNGINANNQGTIDFQSHTGAVETSGDFSTSGSLQLRITGDGNSNIAVGGDATIGGVVSPIFEGVNPAFGDSFGFLSGAKSVALNNPVVQFPFALDDGLHAFVSADSDSASITIGNLPVLSVDRVTGQSEIKNIIGGPLTLDSYIIGSERGLLNPEGWTSLNSQGNSEWIVANPRPQQIAELNFTSARTLEVGSVLDLGSAYNGGATHPRDEDVTFQFTTPEGAVFDGLVKYTGPANDLVLNVDPETGNATIQQLSANVGSIDLTGYNIQSSSGALIPDNWNSFADSGQAGEGWSEANPHAEAVAEVNLGDSHVFDNGTVISIGSIFTPGGLKDLEFTFSSAAGEFFTGTVEYNSPMSWDCNGDGVIDINDANCASAADIDSFLADHGFIAGDLDGDGSVAFQDFLVLSTNFNMAGQYTAGDFNKDGTISFPDFLVLSTNFGKSAAATAVPEPSGLLSLVCGAVLLSMWRRRVRRTLVSRKAEPMAMRWFVTAFLVTLSMVAISASTLQSAEYSQDFDFPDGTDDLEDGSIIFASNTSPDGEPVAQVIDGRLQLTRDDTGSTSANFKIPSLGAEATEGWMASFDVAVASAGSPADGFSFNYGPIADDATGSEEGFGVGLSIEFDTWNNGGGEAGHNVAVDNVDVPGGFNEFDVIVDGETRRTQIIWLDGMTTVKVGDDIIFRRVPTVGFTPEEDFIFAFAARTGGSTEDLFIDNLLIEAPLSGASGSGDFNADGAVDMVDAQILADNFGTGTTFEQGDINRDFGVDVQDFIDFKMVFNSQPANAAAVPEPGSLSLMTLAGGLLLLAVRRNRRRRNTKESKLG